MNSGIVKRLQCVECNPLLLLLNTDQKKENILQFIFQLLNKIVF